MAVLIVSWKVIILERSNFVVLKSSCIYSVRRNYSAFREYVQCMSRHHDTWVNVHHWVKWRDFNSSDCFRPSPRWNTPCLFPCINVAVFHPSMNMAEIISPHIFFLVWSFLKCWYCPLSSITPGLSAIACNIPHAMNMDRFCFILCVCVCNISSLQM
jgi:hypothetical protein